MPQLPYNEPNVKLLRSVILNFLKNKEAGFLIKIDDNPITPRTRDINLFDLTHNQINEYTNTFTLFVYPNKSYNVIEYTLCLQGFEKALNGTEVKNAAPDIAEMRRQLTVEIESAFLKKENETLKRENNYLRRNLDEVEKLVNESKNKSGSQLMDVIKTIGAMVMGNQPAIVTNDAATTDQPVEGVPVSTVKPKGEQQQDNTATTKAAEIARAIVHYYSEHEQEQILGFLGTLKDHKELISGIDEWLTKIIEQRKAIFERAAAQQNEQPQSSVQPQTPQTTNAESDELPATI